MSKRREYSITPYGLYGIPINRFTPIKTTDMIKYTLLKQDGRFRLFIGSWIHPPKSIVFAHGKVTPRELDAYKKRGYIYVYHHTGTHTINIYSFFQAYTIKWISQGTEEQRIARMYPVSDIEWISRKAVD